MDVAARDLEKIPARNLRVPVVNFAELFRDLFGLGLLLFLRHVHSRSVVISLLGRGLFFVARYAGDGLAPSPLLGAEHGPRGLLSRDQAEKILDARLLRPRCFRTP